MGRVRQLIQEEEIRQSTTSTDTETDEDPEKVKEIGPKADVSLLDQHSRLKKEAEGNTLVHRYMNNAKKKYLVSDRYQ